MKIKIINLAKRPPVKKPLPANSYEDNCVMLPYVV